MFGIKFRQGFRKEGKENKGEEEWENSIKIEQRQYFFGNEPTFLFKFFYLVTEKLAD